MQRFSSLIQVAKFLIVAFQKIMPLLKKEDFHIVIWSWHHYCLRFMVMRRSTFDLPIGFY